MTEDIVIIPTRHTHPKNITINMKQFEGKVVVVTGGAQGIGKCIADEFRKEGAHVCIIDKSPLLLRQAQDRLNSPDMGGEDDYFQGDLSVKETIEEFCRWAIAKYGHVDYIVNNALPIMRGIDECSYEEFQYALSVGVTAPFYLVKLLAPHLRPGACIINMSSSRDRMSMPQTESYTAAKGGIAALTHGLAMSLAGRARVNSISPGWIITSPSPNGGGWEGAVGPDATQQPVGRVGNPLDIAHMVLFLCSDKAGFITGENICIDGGMTHQMIYHAEHGWTLSESM